MANAALVHARALTSSEIEARVLHLLHNLFKTTKLERDGLTWTAPKLDWIAQQLGSSKATISRAIRALQERGLLLVRSLRFRRSPRLYIRVLIRARETCGNVTGSTMKRAKINNTDKNNPPSGNMAVPPEQEEPRKASRFIRGKVSEVRDRLERARSERDNNPGHTPTALAHRWNKLLRLNGYPAFDLDQKNLAHVALCLRRIPDLPDRLDDMISNFSTYAPKNAGKVPLPWALHRARHEWVRWSEWQKKNKVPAVKPAEQKKAMPTTTPVVSPEKKLSPLMATLRASKKGKWNGGPK